jgi:S-adenosylmethionine decarboxylase
MPRLLNIGGKWFTLSEASKTFKMCSKKLIKKRLAEGWDAEASALTPSKSVLKKIETKFYGLHLTLDLFDCDRAYLSSIDVVSKYLDEAPGEVGMTKIQPPFVFKYQNSPEDRDWGITGVVTLSTSHASAHSYPEKGYISLDVFSCRGFNPHTVLKKARSVFGGNSFDISTIRRGEGFPK